MGALYLHLQRLDGVIRQVNDESTISLALLHRRRFLSSIDIDLQLRTVDQLTLRVHQPPNNVSGRRIIGGDRSQVMGYVAAQEDQ
jgi:hypothetical protein